MKTPNEFIKTLYLGDRACKRVIIDGLQKRLIIEVDNISRNRNPSGQWEFYTEEDIVDGMVVFEGLNSFEFSPQGFVPSDWIEFISVDETNANSPNTPSIKVILSLGAIDGQGNAKELTLIVCCRSIHLEDPKQPGTRITE